MFDCLLESSHRDDSNKWSNIGFGEEITQVESIEAHFTHLIWSSVYLCLLQDTMAKSDGYVKPRAPDKARKMSFNRLYLCHFFTQSYV